MSFYTASPFKPHPPLASAGWPTYLLGSFNRQVSSTKGVVQSDSAATTTATVTFLIKEGNVPLVGALVTIIGTANSAGVFNATNASILTVSMSATVPGLCTITFTISSTTQSTTADGGLVYIPQTEVAENLTGNGSSIPVAIPSNNPNVQNGASISIVVQFPLANASAATDINIQGADIDLDSEYVTLDTILAHSTPITAGTRYLFQSGQKQGGTGDTPGGVNLPRFNFYRVNFANTASLGSAGATTVVAKALI